MGSYISRSGYDFKMIGQILKIFQDKIKLIMKQTEPYRSRFKNIKSKINTYVSKENQKKALKILKNLKEKIEMKENFVRQIVEYKERLFVLIFDKLYSKVFDDKKNTVPVSTHVKECLIHDKIMGKFF